jgi:RNA polymerase sigma-70 factor, ECF subfamily
VAAEEETTTSESISSSATGRLSHEAAAACLSELHDTHGRAVLGLCRTLLRDPTEAEDALQATFLSAFRSLLKGTVPREPGAWIATIARNECWGRVRSRMREPLLTSETEDIAGGADPLSLAISNEDVGVFWDAFRELSQPQQRAFLLREFGGLSYDELALALGVSGPAVESLLFRARRGLRTSLASAVALPLGLRDLLAQFGTGAAATSVAVKTATVTVGVGSIFAATAGIHAPHHYAHAPAAAVAPIHARRAVVREPAAASTSSFRSASAGRRPRRPAPASQGTVAVAAARVEVVYNEPARIATPRVEISNRLSLPAPESAPAPPEREEAAVPEDNGNKVSAETQDGDQEQPKSGDGGGDRGGDGGRDHSGDSGSSGHSGEGGD